MAGNVEYNGINCRLRTAFKNDRNELMYLEFSVAFNFKDNSTWLIINHLYRIDIDEDCKSAYTKELYQNFIKVYHDKRYSYTQETINNLFHDLGCKHVEVLYCDNYEKREYTPHTNEYKKYNLGNVIEGKIKQLTLFDL